ncbi:hypothetical protein HPB49_023921 [Dermacentor silvarum]|uniref:Uncharacterized protein n=1 Tax=Dermacentor silvarum TaxID=543639 RepID=A0ACB8CIB3_DERSI|nr:hypothetical protein HPB49_023921 [Dermacentor silvarum]
MNPHFHVKRRQSRAAILRRRQEDADTYFTDAGVYPRGETATPTYVAVATNLRRPIVAASVTMAFSGVVAYGMLVVLLAAFSCCTAGPGRLVGGWKKHSVNEKPVFEELAHYAISQQVGGREYFDTVLELVDVDTQCGADETLEHLLCSCPALDQHRNTMVAQLRRMGLPSAASTDLLHPARNPSQVFKVVLGYLADTMLADRL